MDPLTGAVIITGLTTVGKPTVEAVAAIAGRILGASVDAIGEGLAAPLKEWAKRRADNAGRTLIAGAEMVLAAETVPHAVPGRILIPLLEKASVEEDSYLSTQWAALLANTSIDESRILPAYVQILSSLSPLEARVLDALYHPSGDSTSKPQLMGLIAPNLSGNGPFATLLEINYLPIMENLHRMGLLFPTFGGRNRDDNDESIRVSIPGRIQYNYVAISQLGRAFVNACHPPESSP